MSEETALFHVDRDDVLEEGQRIQLSEAYDELSTDARAVLEDFYPDGVSGYGVEYAQDVHSDVDFPSYVCEWIFELVRQNEFPDKPSRFQSIFGTESLEMAEEFVEKFGDGSAAIWRIRCGERHRGDMRLLKLKNVPDCIRNARCYWRGETFHEKPYWEIIGTLPATVVEKEKVYHPDE